LSWSSLLSCVTDLESACSTSSGWSHSCTFATRGWEIYFQYRMEAGQEIRRRVSSSTARPSRWMSSAREISAAVDRDEGAAGKVVTRRGVQGSKPIFAGTRIPVAAVQRYLRAGYDAQAIIAEYPSLTEVDVEAARQLQAAS
jgi:uncharacterized protein (DUF433 family)